jgi:uncharacterized protein YcbK (DUF882 family)
MNEYLNKFKLSPNFNLKEFECPCCQTVKLEPYLINCLQALRYALHCKIYVTSGYRCQKHNTEINGVKDSRHLLGQAVDITVQSIAPEYLLKLASDIGFKYAYFNDSKGYFHLHIEV